MGNSPGLKVTSESLVSIKSHHVTGGGGLYLTEPLQDHHSQVADLARQSHWPLEAQETVNKPLRDHVQALGKTTL